MSTLLVRTKHKWTKGIAITNWTNDKRFFFFELDRPFTEIRADYIDSIYSDYSLDVIRHRTGDGYHWISPTLVDLETWKEIMAKVKDINPKCPMTTLRYEPNKYVNEREIWFSCSIRHYPDNVQHNSIELSNLLNKWFPNVYNDFKASVHTELKLVRYPFP